MRNTPVNETCRKFSYKVQFDCCVKMGLSVCVSSLFCREIPGVHCSVKENLGGSPHLGGGVA